MNYTAVEFSVTNAEQAEQLIALLSNEAFEGFEENELQLKAFIPELNFNEAAFKTILQLFPELAYTKTSVENINWNQQWEESFEPVRVNDFVAIRAGFHQPITNVQHEIIITPKMSFGTGHHSTTFLMIQQMALLDFTKKSVLDFGTGPGVLAILAEKLGANKLLAIDNDEWSITNAIENIAQNNCTKITIEQHNEIPIGDKYDIILANINLNVITANLASIASVCAAPCSILFSGFLKSDETAITAAITSVGFVVKATVQNGNWIALLVYKA